ncbi:hypothetical protein ACIQM4_33975 [Streptomyces sp. NPDC091272]|uniref:hypothetical protein n=1 Tax=Streptomyces sp. NPDC091272 TaxID=3365981 RepID=UPI003809380E
MPVRELPGDRTELVVPRHAYGFPGVGFGGYAAGLLARGFADGASVKVSFRRPVPLGSPLTVRAGARGGQELADGDGALVTARVYEDLVPTPPRVPSWDRALRAEKEHPLSESPFATRDCFGCGMGREPGRGLRQNLALLGEESLVAAAWTPDPALGQGGSTLPAEHLWGALDCPGGWACRLFGDAPPNTVTAYLATTVLRPVVLGEDHVSFGWSVSHSGRKHMAGSAVATREGELCAYAKALWLSPSAGEPAAA